MSRQFSRAELVSRGAKGGAALAITGSVLGSLAGVARADVLPDNDLAYLRLLIVAELLGADFYGNAIEAQPYGSFGRKVLRLARANEGQHYDRLARYLTSSGQVPATAADIDFAYPRDAFASAGSITKLAVELESLFLGVYLGAVDGVESAALKQPLAQIASNQAQHLTVFNQLLGRTAFEPPFPAALTIDAASNGLAAYTS